MKYVKTPMIPDQPATSFENATGTIRFGMTNDFMFRAVFEANPVALKGLICSLLRLAPEEVKSVIITNPFELGDSVIHKDSILDIKVLMNNNTFLNLEMQIAKETYWPERSLTYLCRSFNNLKSGEKYSEVRPATHIGFLDYDLFPEDPEFYATYHMANDVTHKFYTGKFTLSVVSLNRTELATEEDKQYHIDYWAKLFKSTTWEEIRMLAEQNNAIAETAKTMYQMTDDERIQELCFAREEHYRILRGAEEEAELAKAEAAAEIAKAKSEAKVEIENAKAELTNVQTQLSDAKTQLSDAKTQLSDAKTQLSDAQTQLSDAKTQLSEKDAYIAELEARINTLNK